MSKKIGDILKRSGKTVSVAESCTAGLLSYCLTMVPGSSAYFLGGYVVYSPSMKNKTLGLKKALLKNGTVTLEVAEAMAVSSAQKSGSDYSISITGYAGPTGGKEAPVGTVFVSVHQREGRTKTARFHFRGGRERVRKMAVLSALWMFLLFLENQKPGGSP